MSYRKEIYDEVQAELARRRAAAQAVGEQRRRTMTAKIPRIAAMEEKMRSSVAEVGRALAEGRDPSAVVAENARRNLDLQAELAALLKENDCDFANFEPPYTCPVCEDTGYTAHGVCECQKKLLAEVACRRLSDETGLKLTDFDTMELRYYPNETDPALGRSPRAQMADVIEYGRRYAADFGENSPSLLLRGPTGVGKTHFSLAIAAAAARKGGQVIYGPTQTLLRRLEREQFGREEGESEGLMTTASLLILDDLGMEFTTPFYTAALYNILNARILNGLPTVISTNLTQKQMRERYGDAITSRITGHFTPLLFAGKDIRQQKMQETLG